MDEKELAAIQEMARTCCVSYSVGECYSGNKCYDNCALYLKAKELYKAGYRKVPEGAVVLSKEEYERLKQEETYRLLYGRSWTAKRKDDYEEARKETAKEILGKLLSVVQDKRNKLTITTRDPSIGGQCKAYADMETTLREIALDISVEVEK